MPMRLRERLCDCFIHMRVPHLYEPLLVSTLDGNVAGVLRHARALVASEQAARAHQLLSSAMKGDEQSAELHYEYGITLEHMRGSSEEAMRVYTRALELDASLVDARIRLANLQSAAGDDDGALQTLLADAGDGGAHYEHVIDERLLYRQALILYERGDVNRFVPVVRALLAPYFYEVHRMARVDDDGKTLRSFLRTNGMLRTLWQCCVDEVVLHERERQQARVDPNSLPSVVARCGGERGVSKGAGGKKAVPRTLLTAENITQLAFNWIECAFERAHFVELLHVCCYTYTHPVVVRAHANGVVGKLLYAAAMWARRWDMAAEFVKNRVLNNDTRACVWNAFGLVMLHRQDVKYHRYVLRQAARLPHNVFLSVLSGNNSLVSGTYHHALAEYLSAKQRLPLDPYVQLAIGVTFVHLASKKDILRRHDVCLHVSAVDGGGSMCMHAQGLAFMWKYESLRGDCQETYYNLGRAMHQLALFPQAIFYYQKVLSMPLPNVQVPPATHTQTATSGGAHTTASLDDSPLTRVYDMRPAAAHNLALIYKHADNFVMAQKVLREYCTV